MRSFISNAVVVSLVLFSSQSWAENSPRKDSKWDALHRQSTCLNTTNDPLFELKNYKPEASVVLSEGWVNKKGEATVNPYLVDPKTGEKRADYPILGFQQLNGKGRCPPKLSYRWSRDISWTRANGEKVTVTIQRTHKCHDALPSELFTKQKVFVNTEPRNAKNLNLSTREEDAIIAEGVQALQIENENRLAATQINYAAAKVKDVRGVYSADDKLKKYLDPGSCIGNKRTLAQETAAKRFCEARSVTMKKIAGSKFSERDAQCPQLVALTIAETKAAGLAPQPCGRTEIVAGKGEVSYCPIPPSGFAGKVGDLADNGCKVDQITQYNVVVACPVGKLPRLPSTATAGASTAPQKPMAPVAPSTSAK